MIPGHWPRPGSCQVCQMVLRVICRKPSLKIPYCPLAVLRYLSTCRLRKMTTQLKSHKDRCKYVLYETNCWSSFDSLHEFEPNPIQEHCLMVRSWWILIWVKRSMSRSLFTFAWRRHQISSNIVKMHLLMFDMDNLTLGITIWTLFQISVNTTRQSRLVQHLGETLLLQRD